MTDQQIFLDEDWHVHSSFSDGSATVMQNVRAAEARGPRSLCVVDQVRGPTDWVSEFVEACRVAARETAVQGA